MGPCMGPPAAGQQRGPPAAGRTWSDAPLPPPRWRGPRPGRADPAAPRWRGSPAPPARVAAPPGPSQGRSGDSVVWVVGRAPARAACRAAVAPGRAAVAPGRAARFSAGRARAVCVRPGGPGLRRPGPAPPRGFRPDAAPLRPAARRGAAPRAPLRFCPGSVCRGLPPPWAPAAPARPGRRPPPSGLLRRMRPGPARGPPPGVRCGGPRLGQPGPWMLACCW
jgi:hypothetical protein